VPGLEGDEVAWDEVRCPDGEGANAAAPTVKRGGVAADAFHCSSECAGEVDWAPGVGGVRRW
jgi:hypothetical protein